MKKKLVIYAVVAVLVMVMIFMAWRSLAEKEEGIKPTLITVQATSVQEFAQRYEKVDLAPNQRKLMKGGYHFDKVNPIIP